ncbi:MAG: hypothetical protein LYZ69_09490 [Nitrososphaerales archaeon]|nr:hypothetical protein [Nitrososphaerales archaeon]
MQGKTKWPARINDYVSKTVFIETKRGKKFCGRIDDYELGVIVLWDAVRFKPKRKKWIPVRALGFETDMVDLHYQEIRRMAVREAGEPRLLYEWKRKKMGRKEFFATMNS